MTDTNPTPHWEEIRRLADGGETDELQRFMDGLSGVEMSRAMSRLSPHHQQQVLTTLPPEDAASVIEDIPDAQAAAIVEQMPALSAAAIIAEMPSDAQADLIGAIPEASAEAILATMQPEEASDVRALASHDPDVAGGLMITEYLSFADSASVADVIADLQAGAEEYADYDVQYAYIVDDAASLVGVLRMRDLLLAPPGRRVAAMMIREPLSVPFDADLDTLDAFFDHHALLGVPVIGADGTLIGVVKRHDVEQALGDRAEDNYLKSQGIVGGEELRSMPMWLRSRRRLSWLSVNVLLNIMAASIIAVYQDTLSSVIALAVFLPIISDMSGCSGNQAVAVSIRELSLGVIQPSEVMRVWMKEVVVGAFNGLVLGMIIAVAAWLWKGNVWLGLVVGAALCLNTILAVSIGGTIPLILKRLRVDPALASGPVLTTLTDMFGFFLVLSLATLALGKISGA